MSEPGEVRSQGWRMPWFPIVWVVFLILFFPAIQVLPVGFRITITIVSLWSAVVLWKSVPGWRRFLTLPVWVLLFAMIWMAWTFPMWTGEDYQRHRLERYQRLDAQGDDGTSRDNVEER